MVQASSNNAIACAGEAKISRMHRGTSVKAQAKRNPQIAVLDGDPAILDYLNEILADRYAVSLFSDAAKFNQSLRESPAPDLLLLDWNIVENNSEENALGLLGRIRASKPTLPVIMFACSAELKEVIAATQMGAADVILKPFRKSDIDAENQKS